MHEETEVFYDKTPCQLVKRYLRFEEVRFLNIHGTSQCHHLKTMVPRNPMIRQNFFRGSTVNCRINIQHFEFWNNREKSQVSFEREKMHNFLTK